VADRFPFESERQIITVHSRSVAELGEDRIIVIERYRHRRVALRTPHVQRVTARLEHGELQHVMTTLAHMGRDEPEQSVASLLQD
jgi:hypothetical protein